MIYEDEDILVIDKPAGMVVHPAPGHRRDTVANALLARLPGIEEVGDEQRPGIVHRLDMDTSGLMVAAKNRRAHRHVSGQIKDRSVLKGYTALAKGNIDPPEGVIKARIGRDNRNRKRMAVVELGREAETSLPRHRECAGLHPAGGDPQDGQDPPDKGTPIRPRIPHRWRRSLRRKRPAPGATVSSRPPLGHQIAGDRRVHGVHISPAGGLESLPLPTEHERSRGRTTHYRKVLRQMDERVRVRYAPSPTGDPHVGNIRTAMFTWLFARHTQGDFILRIEDTDVARTVDGALESIMDSLRWLGLDWGRGP